jgi:hypothetical protein
VSRRRKHTPTPAGDPDWAKKAVAGMTDAEVRHWCERLGIPPAPAIDTRPPIVRMIDEGCGYKPSGG